MFGNINKLKNDTLYCRVFIFFGFLFISCSKPDAEPRVNIIISNSKILVNGRAISSLDSAESQSAFLIDPLYKILDAKKKEIEGYRDSVVNAMDRNQLMEEDTKPPSGHHVLATDIDSIRNMPYTVMLHSTQRLTYQAFIKLAYTAFQADFDRLYFSALSDSVRQKLFISRQAARCSPFVSTAFGKKQEFTKIELSELDSIDLLRYDQDQKNVKSLTEHEHYNRVLFPGGMKSGSIKVIVEVIPSGMNVKIETFQVHDEQIESRRFILISKGRPETLPNIANQRDWNSLHNILQEIIERLGRKKTSEYCERVITIMLPREASFEEFVKTAGEVALSGSNDPPGGESWYNEIVPGLYYP